MPSKNPFESVTPQLWLERTKMGTFAVRSGTLKKIDQLYNQAYVAHLNMSVLKHPAREFRNTLALLQMELDRYLLEHNATKDWKGPDGKDLNRNQVSKGLMKRLHEFIVDYLGSQPAIPKHDSRHARVGVLYLLGYTQPSMNMLSVATPVASGAAFGVGQGWSSLTMGKLTVGDPAAKINTVVSAVAQHKEQKATALHPNTFRHATVAPSVSETIQQTIKNLAYSIRDYFKIRGESFYSNLGKLIRIATDFVVGILAKASPVGAILDMSQGFVKICSAAVNYLNTRRERTHFMFVAGHPALLAQKIEDEMKYDFVAGLLQVCKGVASAALSAFTVAIGALVLEALSAVIKFFSRFFEMKRIEGFCHKARYRLNLLKDQGYDLKNAEANKGKTFDSLIDDADEFGEFYEEGVNASVAIPILTLNSGICGDLMQMIRIYDAGSDASIESFRAATSYFQRLKLWGCQHIQKKGISFQSSYGNVQNLLYHAVYGHQGTQTTTQKLVSVVSGG